MVSQLKLRYDFDEKAEQWAVKRTKTKANYLSAPLKVFPNNPEHTVENTYADDLEEDKSEDASCSKFKIWSLNSNKLCWFLKKRNQHPGRCHTMLSTKWVHRTECRFDGYTQINKWCQSKLQKQHMVQRDIRTKSTNLLIYKMGQPSRLLFLAPHHISCHLESNKMGRANYMHP